MSNRVPGTTTVHDLDWANHGYASHEESGRVYDVKNGTLEHGHRDDEDYAYVIVDRPAFGDVTGDHTDEAVVRIVVNTGGSGWVDFLSVFTMRDGQPIELGTIGGGDRGDGGIVSATVLGGDIVVVRNQSQDGDGACCPSMQLREVWHWTGKQFVKDESKTTSAPKPKDAVTE